jgi:hypothetical protein
MKMTSRKNLFLTACASALIISATPADAWRATEWTLSSTRNRVAETRDAVRDTKKAVEEVRLEVRESADRIIAALRGHSGEQSAHQNRAVEANRRIVDAAQQNDAQRLRQEFRAKAESGNFDPNPDICLLAGLYRGGGSAPAVPTGSRVVGNAAAMASGADPAVREGGTRFARSIVDDKLAFEGLLGVPDPTTNSAAILANPSLPDFAQGSPEDQAMQRLVRNLVDPNPPRPVTSEELRTPEGVQRAAARAIQETRNSASGEVVTMLMNMRELVQPVTAEGFQAFHDDIANYNRPWPGVGGEISELQAIDIRTLRYYAPKPEIFHDRSTWTEKQLLQALLDAVSVGNRIGYLQLELDTRTAMLQTQILSALNN